LPKSILAKFDIKRFGYHGLSMASIVGKTKSKNVIICHLGGGTSMAYIKFGKSLETSMGYTPLEGLIGSTRSGNIDPGIFLCLNKKYSVKQIESILNNQSGLKALSGKTDMKEILKSNNKKALDFYISQIKSYIGAYIAKYPEINEIIFTGAIGAGSWKIRQMICNNLQHLGISLDNQKNQKIKEGMEGSFSKGKLKLSVIKTDEESEILKQIK
jgi:acetate kinase